MNEYSGCCRGSTFYPSLSFCPGGLSKLVLTCEWQAPLQLRSTLSILGPRPACAAWLLSFPRPTHRNPNSSSCPTFPRWGFLSCLSQPGQEPRYHPRITPLHSPQPTSYHVWPDRSPPNCLFPTLPPGSLCPVPGPSLT